MSERCAQCGMTPNPDGSYACGPSQQRTQKSAREAELEDLLRSAHCIALRKGQGTAWERFAASISKLGIGSITARTYRILPDDPAEGPKPDKNVLVPPYVMTTEGFDPSKCEKINEENLAEYRQKLEDQKRTV